MHCCCIFFHKNLKKKKKSSTFAPAFEKRADDLNFLLRKKIAEIAQLVEHDLAKVGVASSSLFFCPDGGIGRRVRFRCACREVCRFESCSGHKKDTLAQVVKLVYTLL